MSLRALCVSVLEPLVTAGSVALITCLVLLGRADPLRPSLLWAFAYGIAFLAALGWATRFTRGMASSKHASFSHIGFSLLAVHGPLVALSLAASAAIYLSDDINHQVTHFMWPTAPLLILLAVLGTHVAQSAVLLRAAGTRNSVRVAIDRATHWALPLCLGLLGLCQGASYLWVIGNDFTRYWNVADAIASWTGYPAMTTLPLYVQIGEPLHTVDLPGYPLALLAAFALLGHDTLAAHVPNLLANAALPVLTYRFFRGAAIGRPIAFAGSAALVTQPFFRLYTLNAPVPDAFFMALLVGTAIAYQRVADSRQQSAISGQSSVISHQSSATRLITSLTQDSAPRTQDWLIFGVLAGATALTRPEGLFFLAFMGLGLLPALRQRGPWLAGLAGIAMLAPVVAVMRSTFGYFWPNNAGTAVGPQHIAANLFWLQEKTLWWYANAFQISMPQFLAMLALLALCILAGTVWMLRERWKLALLPIGAVVNVGLVFIVDPNVSGVHLWFDFFRHISYALPFLALALAFLLDRLFRWAGARLPSSGTGVQSRTDFALRVAGLLLLCVSFYQLSLLAQPSQTFGGSRQLLTSDVWVSFQDIVEHRYQLPRIPLARDGAGVLVPERNFDRQYLINHLDSVRKFFEPYSTLSVNKGGQYMISSALLLLFGAVFAFAGAREGLRRIP